MLEAAGETKYLYQLLYSVKSQLEIYGESVNEDA